jgi:carboxylesterase
VSETIRDRSFYHAGSKTGFLLIHGLTGTPIELRYISNGLARAGFTVSVPQLAGHCGTLEDLKATHWQDWYQSAEDALLELKKTCDLVIVGGLSMGAVIALKLAAEHPDTVDGATLFAPTFRFDGWSIPWYGRFFDLVNDTWSADRFLFKESEPYGIKNVRFREFVMNAINSEDSSQAGLPGTPGRSLMEFRFLTKAVNRVLGLIRQPVLVLHPREDDRASLSNVEHLQRRLGGRVTTVVLEDCYHVITLDQQRDVVLEETREYGFKLEREAIAAKKIEPRAVPVRIAKGGSALSAG